MSEIELIDNDGATGEIRLSMTAENIQMPSSDASEDEAAGDEA